MPTVNQMTEEQARELFEIEHTRKDDAFYWDDLHDSLSNHIEDLLTNDPRYAYLRIYTNRVGGDNYGASKYRMTNIAKIMLTIAETSCDSFEISDFELDLDRLSVYGSVAEKKAFLTDVVGLTLPEQLALHAGAAFCSTGCRVLPELSYSNKANYRDQPRKIYFVDIGAEGYLPDDKWDRHDLLVYFCEEYEHYANNSDYRDQTACTFQESVAKWLPMLSGANLLALFPDHAALAELYIGALDKLYAYYMGFVETLEEGLAKQSEYMQSFEYWYDIMDANEVEFEIDEDKDNG